MNLTVRNKKGGKQSEEKRLVLLKSGDGHSPLERIGEGLGEM